MSALQLLALGSLMSSSSSGPSGSLGSSNGFLIFIIIMFTIVFFGGLIGTIIYSHNKKQEAQNDLYHG
jgi:uncharacterized BrkB/YihY/UPF0761 family membrane protein